MSITRNQWSETALPRWACRAPAAWTSARSHRLLSVLALAMLALAACDTGPSRTVMIEFNSPKYIPAGLPVYFGAVQIGLTEPSVTRKNAVRFPVRVDGAYAGVLPPRAVFLLAPDPRESDAKSLFGYPAVTAPIGVDNGVRVYPGFTTREELEELLGEAETRFVLSGPKRR